MDALQVGTVTGAEALLTGESYERAHRRWAAVILKPDMEARSAPGSLRMMPVRTEAGATVGDAGEIEEIRPGYRFDVSNQGSVPEALIAFLDISGIESDPGCHLARRERRHAGRHCRAVAGRRRELGVRLPEEAGGTRQPVSDTASRASSGHDLRSAECDGDGADPP